MPTGEFIESLIQMDNGPGRSSSSVLDLLKGKCHAFFMKSPPEKTHLVQAVDDNVGRTFRDAACDKLEDDIGELSEDKVLSLTAIEKRELMVKAVDFAFQKWNLPGEKYIGIGERAALRTGLAMRINNDCSGVRPVRFPDSYPSSIPRTSGAPDRPYYIHGELADPVQLNSVAAAVSSTAGTISLDVRALAPGTGVQISAVGMATSVSLTPPIPSLSSVVMEENGVFDGWSDEEERVYLDDEVDPESSSSEEDTPYSRRRTKRLRWCIEGCDCERLRGRKCLCELKHAGCTAKCSCDPAMCRARQEEEAD